MILNRQTNMNGVAADRKLFPVVIGHAAYGENTTWLQRRLLDLGVYEPMTAPKTAPPEIRINFTTVLFYIAVLSFIASGFYWTWQRGVESGIEKGASETRRVQAQKELDQMQQQITELKDQLQKKKELELLNHNK